MAKEATLQVRTDSEMKERAEALHQRRGTIFAGGVRMFAAESLLIERERGAFSSAMEAKHGGVR